jgi:hypothetical protein
LQQLPRQHARGSHSHNTTPNPPTTHSFLLFLAVYSGVANNASLSRFIRYNAMQAVLLDVLIM